MLLAGCDIASSVVESEVLEGTYFRTFKVEGTLRGWIGARDNHNH